MRVRPIIVLSVAWLLAARLAPAQDLRDAPHREGVSLIVKTVDEDALAGRAVAFSLGEGIVLRTADGERQIPTRDLVRMRALNAPRRPKERQRLGPGEMCLTLSGGDLLIGRLIGTDAEREAIVVDTIDLGEVAVPISAVTAAAASCADAGLSGGSARHAESHERSYEDTVTLTNGDLIAGFVNSITNGVLAIETETGARVVPLHLVASIRFANDEWSPPDDPHMVIGLRQSGRLTVTDLNLTGAVIEARLLYGPTILVEAERVEHVDVVRSRWEWLSRHQPISYQHTPMLSLGWDYEPDRNVAGGPIRVADNWFEHGLGVHSRSTLTYDLKGGYQSFVTLMGLDDSSGPLADVTTYIRVDGTTRHTRERVRPGTLHGPVRIDISGANRLELIVDYGANGDLQDRFDWVEAALIR